MWKYLSEVCRHKKHCVSPRITSPQKSQPWLVLSCYFGWVDRWSQEKISAWICIKPNLVSSHFWWLGSFKQNVSVSILYKLNMVWSFCLGWVVPRKIFSLNWFVFSQIWYYLIMGRWSQEKFWAEFTSSQVKSGVTSKHFQMGVGWIIVLKRNASKHPANPWLSSTGIHHLGKVRSFTTECSVILLMLYSKKAIRNSVTCSQSETKQRVISWVWADT